MFTSRSETRRPIAKLIQEKRDSIMAQGSSGKDIKMYTVWKHFLIEVLIYNIISFSCTLHWFNIFIDHTPLKVIIKH